MNDSVLPPWPCFDEHQAKLVSTVLLSNKVNFWTGTETRSFETEFAEWCGCNHAIAVANGTVALDLALHGLGIGQANGGATTDEVIVTPRTFIASVSCVINAGATPIFADVDRDSGNITAAEIREKLSPQTKAIIPVHLAGWPCELDEIVHLAAQNSVHVIEDCAQAHGAMFKGRSVGSIGKIGAWSFCQDKIITTGGEGGMVTTSDRKLWEKMWSFKDHGKSWDAVYNRDHPSGFRWLHESFGTNWRMMELQAVLGRDQLRRLQGWRERRAEIASAVRMVLSQFPKLCRVPVPPLHSRHAQYRQYAYVIEGGLKEGWSRDKIVAECGQRGAPVFQGTCSEVYNEKAFDNIASRPSIPLPVAAELGRTSLMFLTHPNINNDQLLAYTDIIGSILEQATA